LEINENLVYEKYDLNKTDLESIYRFTVHFIAGVNLDVSALSSKLFGSSY